MTLLDPTRLGAIARKEWIQIRRDRRSLYLACGLPLLLLIFFGYAINGDIEDLPLSVLERDHTAPEAVEPVRPSLEDIFVARVREAGGAVAG